MFLKVAAVKFFTLLTDSISDKNKILAFKPSGVVSRSAAVRDYGLKVEVSMVC